MKSMSEILRQAADDVESGKRKYKWIDGDKCNCGIVAQIVLGNSSQSLEEIGVWGWEVDRCKATGIVTSEAIASLTEIGFTLDDIIELENLSNLEIRGRACLAIAYLDKDYDAAPAFIRYVRAWADLIDERQASSTTGLRGGK